MYFDLVGSRLAVKSQNCVSKPNPHKAHEHGQTSYTVPVEYFSTKEEIISSNIGPSGLRNVCYFLLDEVNSLTYQPYEAVPQ